jgi:uncharacterized tellurite resistance protein B-like protein
MFDRFKAIFSGKTPAHPLTPHDARHALGALMVRAAGADRAYLFEEIERIDRILAQSYGLNPVEAAKMRAACERLEKEMPDTAELAEILHSAIPDAEAEAAVRSLWQVVFADGQEHEAEDKLLHEIEAFLGVPADVAQRIHDEEAAKLI